MKIIFRVQLFSRPFTLEFFKPWFLPIWNYRHYKGSLYQTLTLVHYANDPTYIAVVYFPLQIDVAHGGPHTAIRTYDDFYGYIQPELELEMGLSAWKA